MWYYVIWLFRAVFDICVTFIVTLTSEQLEIIIFQIGSPEYHNLDTLTMKLTHIRPILSVAILDAY